MHQYTQGKQLHKATGRYGAGGREYLVSTASQISSCSWMRNTLRAVALVFSLSRVRSCEVTGSNLWEKGSTVLHCSRSLLNSSITSTYIAKPHCLGLSSNSGNHFFLSYQAILLHFTDFQPTRKSIYIFKGLKKIKRIILLWQVRNFLIVTFQYLLSILFEQKYGRQNSKMSSSIPTL